MDVIDYYGPRVAKCKLSETDNEALFKMCLEATEPFNSKLLGNIREQNTITNALKNTTYNIGHHNLARPVMNWYSSWFFAVSCISGKTKCRYDCSNNQSF